jgi:hypothetical protein
MRYLAAAALLAITLVSTAAAESVQELNKRTVSLIFTDIFVKWRMAENEHIYSPDYVGHAGDQNYTRAQDRAAVEGWKTFSPEGKMTILQMVAEDDKVVVLWKAEGVTGRMANARSCSLEEINSLLSATARCPPTGWLHTT